jgi:hypothetical protein
MLIGISNMVSIHHGWLWFPERPGLISGLIIGGFGVGALIFDNVSTYLINPTNLGGDDLNYEYKIDDRFVMMLRKLCLCFSLIVVIGVVGIFPGPPKVYDG